MIRSLTSRLAVVLAFACWAAPAWAEDREAARRHFAEAERRYAAGEWSAALAEYQAAHDAAPLPEFLFNQAQCERQLGHPAEAMALYQQFLAEKPDAPNRQTVEDLIDETRAAAAAPSTTATTSTPAPDAESPTSSSTTTSATADQADVATAPASEEPVDERSPLARIRVTTWVALGGTALSFAISGLFALDASDAESDLADPSLRCRVQLSHCLDLKDRGDRSSILRNTFFVIGLAGLAGTAVLAYLDLTSGSSDEHVAWVLPAVSPNAVALTGGFTWR